MRKTRNSLGFTMAELLIVVAIIAVLGGVVFIAVQNHQRSMAQLERNATAKELFIAAQNHLTMAESQGYPVADPGSAFFGEPAGDTAESDTKDDETDTPAEGTDTSDGENTEADAGNKITNVYYVIGPSSGNILDQILPFGSIDETVRAGGSYLIRYQTNPARVLDVFYVTTSGNPTRFNKDGGIEDDDYSDLMGMRDSLPSNGYVLGYYGGEEALASGDIIQAPTVEVHNEERLTVTVADLNNNNVDPTKRNANAALKLIITGETSGAKMAIALDSTSATNTSARFSYSEEDLNYTVILDDITTAYDSDSKDGLHFAHLNAYAETEGGVIEFWKDGQNTLTFLPGENITVQAVAYSNTALTNIAYSSARTTNSLFADPGEVDTTAMIANFRHLENLDADISNLDKSLGFTDAEQIADMIWKDEDESTPDFVNAIIEDKSVGKVNIYKISDLTGGGDDCFLPVIPSTWGKAAGAVEGSVEPSKLSYEGNGHTITGVVINGTSDSGLFSSLITGSSVSNLKLVDFSVETSEGNAGALVGKLVQKTSLGDGVFNVSNVVAYNTGNGTDATIKTDSGNAGGLIGQIVGNEATDATDKTAKAVIQKSSAALIVSATGGDAGGLIGIATGGTVTACYSGGHTINSTLTGSNAVVYDATNYNVTATASGTTGGVAGGLIGSATATEITYCYSTCSATGATVGGLIGTGSGAITNSYCTGLVKSTAATPVEGAFAGSWTYTGKTDDDGNWYFDIINEREEKDDSGNLTGGYTYLYPVSGSEAVKGLTALDESAAQFNEFCPAPTDWNPALPYEATLKAYYGEGSGDKRVARYNLKTVEQLGAAVTKNSGAEGDTTIDDFVTTHYGDWPAPEIFVVNTK